VNEGSHAAALTAADFALHGGAAAEPLRRVLDAKAADTSLPCDAVGAQRYAADECREHEWTIGVRIWHDGPTLAWSVAPFRP